MTNPAPDRLLAGEIGKPHGISGEVYVVPISDDPRRFEPGSRLQWRDRDLVVAGARRHGNRLLVKFEGVDDRNTAETLRGPLFVPATEARTLEDNEFWPHDLIGCEVWTVGHAPHGQVKDGIPGVAQDLLVVATENGEHLVPLVKEIVVKVDLEAGIVLLDPPAGLLD